MENWQRLRYKLTKYVENSKSNHNLRPLIEEILKTSSKLKERYCCIDVVQLLHNNVRNNSVPEIKALIEALKVLEKYGKNLLREDRPMFWRVIMFSNEMFKEKVDVISGSRDILKQMGYTETIINGFSFPNAVESPNIRLVSLITSDIVLLRCELVLYLKRQHPSSNSLRIVLSRKSFSSTSGQSQGHPSTSKSLEPSLDSLCAVCGQNLSEFHCPTCKMNQCSSCDHKWHLNRGRVDHQRNRILPSLFSQSSTNIMDEPIPNSAQFSDVCSSVFFAPGFASPSLLVPVTSQIESIESPINNTENLNVSSPRGFPPLTSNFKPSAEANLDWEEKFEVKKKELSLETDINLRKQIFTKFCQEVDVEVQKYTNKADGLDHLLLVKRHFIEKAQHLLKQKNSLENYYFSLNPNSVPKNFDDQCESYGNTEHNKYSKISHKPLEASFKDPQEPLPKSSFLSEVGDPVLTVPAKKPLSKVNETLKMPFIRTEDNSESNTFSTRTQVRNESSFEKPITFPQVVKLQYSFSNDDEDETVPAVVSDRRTVQFKPTINFNPTSVTTDKSNQSEKKFQSPMDLQLVAKKESLRLKCLKTVGNLRLAQSQGFDAQNLPVALEKANIDLSGNILLKKLENFKSEISQVLQVYPCLSFSEACNIFYLCDGNLAKTQEVIELQHSAKLKALCQSHLFNNTDLIESLKQNDGNCSKAVLELQKPLVQDFFDRLQEPCGQKFLVRDFLSMRDDEHLKSALVTVLSIEEVVVADVMCCVLSKIRDHLEPFDDFLDEVIEYNIDDVHEAVTSFPGSVELAIKYLNNKCKVCFGSFPQNKLTCMVACRDPGCIYCHDCLAKHLDITIRERNIRDLVCPVCMLPDVDIDEEATLTHFNHLDKVIKEYLGEQTHEMYEKKLRDYAVRKMPNFRWCSHCENGFIYDNYENLKMVCSACNKATCYNCKKRWEVQHEGISCQAFLEWKQQNDEDFQAKGLAAHLKEHGIDCPSCNYRYALAKGGCMHFKCLMCSYQFCSGCKSPFKLGRVCNMMPDCFKKGLHAHHPRDCLFFLRDFEIERLQHILSEANVSFGTESKLNSSFCSVLEQKETSVGLVDEACGREVLTNSADLCVLHYKEYLVNLINSNHLDPAIVFSDTELEVCLTRSNKNLPSTDIVDNYRDLLLNAVKLLPLIHEKRTSSEQVADNQRTAGATTSSAI